MGAAPLDTTPMTSQLPCVDHQLSRSVRRRITLRQGLLFCETFIKGTQLGSSVRPVKTLSTVAGRYRLSSVFLLRLFSF